MNQGERMLLAHTAQSLETWANSNKYTELDANKWARVIDFVEEMKSMIRDNTEVAYIGDLITLGATGVVYRVIAILSMPEGSNPQRVRLYNVDAQKEEEAGFSLVDWHRLTFSEIQQWEQMKIMKHVFNFQVNQGRIR